MQEICWIYFELLCLLAECGVLVFSLLALKRWNVSNPNLGIWCLWFDLFYLFIYCCCLFPQSLVVWTYFRSLQMLQFYLLLHFPAWFLHMNILLPLAAPVKSRLSFFVFFTNRYRWFRMADDAPPFVLQALCRCETGRWELPLWLTSEDSVRQNWSSFPPRFLWWPRRRPFVGSHRHLC